VKHFSGSLFAPRARLNRVNRLVWTLAVCALAASAAESPAITPGCLGATPLGKFRISIAVPWKGAAIPITDVTSIPTGARLIWDPVRLQPHFAQNGEIAALIITKTSGELLVLDPHKAGQRTEWDLPRGADVVALVIGPDGLSMNKVKSLIASNPDLLPQLAAYAQQNSQVESLVQALADSEQSGGGADAALRGFSSRWGVATPKLDPKASTDQQASTLLGALLPSAGSYDPLATGSAQMQQTTGLAASLAGLFFGNGVGLAAGGAALVTNLKGALFPNTDFRSVYAQSSDGLMAFCAKAQAAKSRTRAAYLWAYKAPGLALPSLSIDGPSWMPLGAKSTLKIKAAENSTAKDLPHATEWRLVPASGAPVPAAVMAAADLLTLDLTHSKAAAGDYQLSANWDWDTFTVGTVHLRPFADFAKARIEAASADQLVQGSGVVTIPLTGADFEFVEKAELQKVAARPGAKPAAVPFELPNGPRKGEQTTLKVDIDTSAAGTYKLELAQADGTPHAIPVTVLPPNPKVTNLPVHVNAGDTEAPLRLEGTGLDRIDSITTDAGTVSGGKLRLKPAAKAGESFAVRLHVHGLEAPLVIPNGIVVVGARPKILSARKSQTEDSGVQVRPDELPAGTDAGFVLSVAHLNDGDGREESRPRLELRCRSGEARRVLALSPGEPVTGVSLSAAGADSLYLSLDPGLVGYPGCELTATLMVQPRGSSEAVLLGRIVRLPVLEKFTVSSEALGPNRYAGALEGRDLDVIERAGWDAQNGLPVSDIPTPVSPTRQTLRIAVPWPSPAPHAPLYIWLRGETAGRRTRMAE
jgi:hypothetical protein